MCGGSFFPLEEPCLVEHTHVSGCVMLILCALWSPNCFSEINRNTFTHEVMHQCVYLENECQKIQVAQKQVVKIQIWPL